MRKFTVEFVDGATGCICDQKTFLVPDVLVLCSCINLDATDIRPGEAYELEPDEFQAIALHYSISSAMVGVPILRCWLPIDDLPYAIHTGRELAMMLAGTKPLAAFSEFLPAIVNVELTEELRFASYVTEGIFRKYEYVDKIGDAEVRHILYCLPGEEWRFNAYRLLNKTAAIVGWSEGFERIEGSLLGYEDWQNDLFIERIFKGNK